MAIIFTPGKFYTVINKISPAAVANGHLPNHIARIEFIEFQYEHGGEVQIAVFAHGGKRISFDTGFVNNGRTMDNSDDIIELPE